MIGRLIPLATGHPIQNMAVDQALLESTGESGVPTLRLYRWDRPTLSLGYFQKLDDRAQHARSGSLDCVRRSTGGGAIVHHHELTYSLFMPVKQVAGPSLELYETIHGEFIELLREQGVTATPFRMFEKRLDQEHASEPFLCFQRRTSEDLIVSGYKVLGSAQRKVRGAVLQHGSLLLQCSEWAPELPGIAELTGRFVSGETVADAIADRLAKRLTVSWTPSALSAVEQQAAGEIANRKFGSDAWHHRR